MQIKITALVAFLLPLAAMAAPTAEPAPEDASVHPFETEEPFESYDTSPEALGLEKRASVKCSIVNTESAYVNCRAGHHFDDSIVASAKKGSTYTFTCYKSSRDCYKGNCTWQRTKIGGSTCYVNGYYTSGACTAAKLGEC